MTAVHVFRLLAKVVLGNYQVKLFIVAHLLLSGAKCCRRVGHHVIINPLGAVLKCIDKIGSGQREHTILYVHLYTYVHSKHDLFPVQVFVRERENERESVYTNTLKGNQNKAEICLVAHSTLR